MEKKIFRSSIPMIFKTSIESRDPKALAEKILWTFLKENPSGYVFYRQHQFYHYLADFYCFELNLVIEVCTGNREKPELGEKEKQREEWLREQGFSVLRFTNFEIEQAFDKVAFTIENKISLINNVAYELSWTRRFRNSNF